MKRWIKRLGLLLGLLVVAFVAFFLWASSGTLSVEELASAATYAADYAAPRDTLTVMTYNIGYLSGMTNNLPVERSRALFEENMEQAAQLIREADPDVVAFQEIDFGADRSYGVDQLRVLAERLGYAASARAVNWDERYLPFPYGWPSVHFGRVLSGQAVLSRFPIRRHERVELARTSRPFWSDAFYLDRLAQVVELDVGRPLVLLNVHLEAFEEATREAQAREVRALYAQHAAAHPTLLVGDFNAPTPEARRVLSAEEQAQFAGDETVRLLTEGTALRAALADSASRAPLAATGTYPADTPRVAIDHIFYPPEAIEPLEARVVGGGIPPPSDHRAVVMRFVLPR